jgi:RNA polymerase sigma-70 factor (ECF subfamily)
MLVPGRNAAFEKAVNAYFNDLYRFAYWLCRDRWQAEDIVQESLVRAWRGWAGLRDERAVKAWLFTIVHREFRRAGARAARAEPLAHAEELAFHPDPVSPIDIERALQELPEDSCEALLMQVLGGFSCADIAAALRSSEGAVMTRLTRARQVLRRRLDPSGAKAMRQA